MEDRKTEYFANRLKAFWSNIFNSPEEESGTDVRKEKVLVFIIAFVMALCLWLIVNLSRDYNINVNLPISLGNMPEDRALSEELPRFATVSITGEGWKLINIYNNPPQIFVDVTRDEINLYDQVQQQMNATPDLNVMKVQPLLLNLELEDRISKKVPIVSRVDVNFRDQYDFVDEPRLNPDSVTVSGAASLVRDIDQWATDSVQISNVRADLAEAISLKEPPALLELSLDEVTYVGDVAQYTEGESRITIQTRGLPRGRSVSYSPSAITVRYDVPIGEYAEVSELQNLLTAYVNYSQLRTDSTGFVVPNIERTANSEYHIKIRSFQPGEVSYFMVVGN